MGEFVFAIGFFILFLLIFASEDSLSKKILRLEKSIDKLNEHIISEKYRENMKENIKTISDMEIHHP